MNTRLWILVLGLTACDGGSTEIIDGAGQPPDLTGTSLGMPADDGTTTEEEEETDLPGVGSDDLGSGDAFGEEAPPARALKRMSVPQVRASMEQISGGIAWASTRENYWDAYASTLGVPDYQESVSEDLSPSVIFQKFLDDAASFTCDRWVAEVTPGFFDVASVDEEDPQRIRRNIASLRHRIQGHPNVLADDVLDAYMTLYDRVVRRTDDRSAAWTTVCVALFTHPDFYHY